MTDKKQKDDKEFDVVLLHGKTPDGEGTRVLRARPGRLETGEVRPLQEGRPMQGGGQVVQLSQREGTPLYDVDVKYEVPETSGRTTTAHAGPAQVATRAYRESWDRTFGSAPRGRGDRDGRDRTLN